MRGHRTQDAFTLIELLIVVAIIAILAAIAVPNFLEAQTRAKVSRVQSDMRNVAIAIESFRIDNNNYPPGTDNPDKYPAKIGDFLGALNVGFYTFQTRDVNKIAGHDFPGLTTPVAYMTSIPTDPFAVQASSFLTYCYRNAKEKRNGWVLTSAGPDADLLAAGGFGTTNLNPLSTAVDTNSPARLGDINEREVIHFIEGDASYPGVDTSRLREYLYDLTYDPSNGSVSDGDLWRLGP